MSVRTLTLLARYFISVSIHAPRAGYDSEEVPAPVIKGISIHVPRAGYDFLTSRLFRKQQNFYPRTPCGVRRSCF